MAPTRFADLAKKPSDLLTNDYSYDRKFKVTTKTANGVTLVSEGSLNDKGFEAKLTGKLSPAQGVYIDKACVTSGGRLIGEVTIKELRKGVDAIARFQEGGNKKAQGEMEIRLAQEKFAVDTTFDFVNPTIKCQTSFQVNDKVILGVSAKFDTKYDDDKSSAQFTEYDVAGSYNQNDLTVVLASKAKLAEGSLALYHDVSNQVQVAAQIDFGVTKAQIKDLTFGGIYTIDADSKFQAKVDSKGLLSANYIQIIKPGVKGVASLQIDGLNYTGDQHKFGLSLILG